MTATPTTHAALIRSAASRERISGYCGNGCGTVFASVFSREKHEEHRSDLIEESS